MEVKITYIYHSCFLLNLGKKILLFDYPGKGVKAGVKKKLRSQINGSELYVFISHGHGDHFSPEVTEFSSDAERTHFLISSDIRSERLSIGPSDRLESVGPDRSYRVNGLGIKTFKSNDAGVAFLIDWKDITIYYGGDLARWDWPEWSKKKRDEHVKVFEEVTDILQEKNIDIAFSNMDERLSGWAGPIEFIEKVEPNYFVPMHTFGSEEWIEDLVKEGWNAPTEVFEYRDQGEQIIWEL